MSDPASVSELLLKPQRGKPDFVSEVSADQLVDVVMRLAMEISALRDRLDVHEALAEKHGFGGPEVVDSFELDEATRDRQAARRERWVQRVIHDLTT